jgi:hypothetical protein
MSMQNLKQIVIITSCLINTQAVGQLINGPVVEGRFQQVYLTENFDSVSKAWPVVSNADNLLLIQNGEMILQRRTDSAPFAVLGSFDKPLSEFRLITSLKLNKAGVDGSLGLIFMAQTGGKGGFIFEVNQHQQYRLRQITGSVYRFMSGDAKSNGWVKNTLVKSSGDANLLEVRTSNRKYDIFLNNRYLLSFTEMEYRNGGIGFIIGPSSKGTIDFLYIFQGDHSIASGKQYTDASKDSLAELDIVVLTSTIIRLKTQTAELTSENEELHKLLKIQRSENGEINENVTSLKGQISELQVTSARLRHENDSLQKVNDELNRFKSTMDEQGDAEVLLTLSRSLKTEKARNEELLRENALLKEQVQKHATPVKE